MRYWMVDEHRAPQGPFEREEIVRRIGSEAIEPARLVCVEGGQQWVEICSEFPALYGQFASAGASDVQPGPGRTPPTARPLGPGPSDHAGSAPSEGAGVLGFVIPIGVEPCSLAAGYLGILSLAGGFLAPVALGFSIAGLIRLRKRPHLRGHVRCAIGIVGGLLGLLVLVAVAGSMFA